MLAVAVLAVMLMIVSTLDLLERVNDLVFLFLIRGEVISLIAVPVHVLLGSFLIDVVTVSNVEAAIIVLWIVSPMLAGPAIVSCHFHR